MSHSIGNINTPNLWKELFKIVLLHSVNCKTQSSMFSVKVVRFVFEIRVYEQNQCNFFSRFFLCKLAKG